MVALLTDMLSAAGNQTTSVVDEINRTLALSMARHAALSYGTVLDNTEMENLVNNLFACSNFNYTPDGKTILCTISGKIRMNYIRILPGDRVVVEISPYDLTRGRITCRYK